MITATREYIDGLCTALTQESGIKLIDGDAWAADVKRRTLQFRSCDLTQMPPDAAKGLLIHEVGHLLYTDAGDGTELEKTYPAMHSVYNGFEDIRIEKKLGQKFGDFADYPLAYLKSLVVDSMGKITDDSPASVLQQAISYAILSESISETGQHNTPNTGQLATAYYKKCSPTGQSFLQDHHRELEQAGRHCSDLQSTSDLKRLIDTEVFPVIKELLEHIPLEQQRNMTGIDGKPQDKAGQLKDMPPKNTFTTIPTDRELDAILRPYINTLTRQLTQVLKERRATRFTGLHRSGKLLSRSAYKVLTAEERIFSHKTTPDKADYNIITCLDGSGSMGNNNKHVNTYIAAYLLDRTLEKLGFTRSFMEFTDITRELESLEEYRILTGGSTYDEGALEKAYTRIDPLKENIVLVMTDGETSRSDMTIIKKLHDKNVLVIGIGIGIDGDQLRQAYGDAISVPEISQLPAAVIALLKRLIHR